jgi:iron(III) transport system substrate-binding protein
MLLLMLACEAQPIVEGEPAVEPAEAPVVTVYSGRSEALVGALLEQAEADLGLEIEVQYGDTPELVTRLLAEGAESPADLILAQDSGHLGALSEREAIAPLPESLLAQVDPAYRDPAGRWVGTSGRLRVLVVNASLPVDQRPASLKDLADPKWKGQLGWAPSNGSFQCHVSALRALWGEDETRAWLAAVQANEPTVYPKNSPQVVAAHEGEIQIGWVNHYYLHQKKTEGYQALNHSLAPGDAGNIMMLAGGAVRAGAEHPADAERVLEWLVSEKAQSAFAQDNFEYPTRPGVPTHADVPAIDPAALSEVSQTALADVGPTRTMLQELGLQ